ncbi:MAG: HAMP domain-containing protein, partial [Proteobacteria bacterium]
MVALLAIAIAIGVYPLARRITGRLERLQTQVDQLGAGDLTARVEVLGKDEVANLARSFNRAADRIENLVEAKRMMLASASHELRTPLTRIRMAVELLDDSDRPELRQKIAEDIAAL